MTDRRPLNRTQVILLCQRQAEGRILCGCGCGEPLEPVNEGVIDEHDLPRKLSAAGYEAERDSLENRGFLRKPCAWLKTKADLATIAKAKAQGGETGQYARRQKRGHGSIASRPNGFPAKGTVKFRNRPSKNSLRAQGSTQSGER